MEPRKIIGEIVAKTVRESLLAAAALICIVSGLLFWAFDGIGPAVVGSVCLLAALGLLLRD